VCVRVCVRVCVCARARACMSVYVRARARACARACLCARAQAWVAQTPVFTTTRQGLWFVLYSSVRSGRRFLTEEGNVIVRTAERLAQIRTLRSSFTRSCAPRHATDHSRRRIGTRNAPMRRAPAQSDIPSRSLPVSCVLCPSASWLCADATARRIAVPFPPDGSAQSTAAAHARDAVASAHEQDVASGSLTPPDASPQRLCSSSSACADGLWPTPHSPSIPPPPEEEAPEFAPAMPAVLAPRMPLQPPPRAPQPVPAAATGAPALRCFKCGELLDVPPSPFCGNCGTARPGNKPAPPPPLGLSAGNAPARSEVWPPALGLPSPSHALPSRPRLRLCTPRFQRGRRGRRVSAYVRARAYE
jgi:hypothetical protein